MPGTADCYVLDWEVVRRHADGFLQPGLQSGRIAAKHLPAPTVPAERLNVVNATWISDQVVVQHHQRVVDVGLSQLARGLLVARRKPTRGVTRQ